MNEKELDATTLHKLKKKFKFLINKYGMSDKMDAEDVTHDYILYRLQGRGENQRLDFYFVDIMRSKFGRSGSNVDSSRQRARLQISEFFDSGYLDTASGYGDRVSEAKSTITAMLTTTRDENSKRFIEQSLLGRNRKEIAASLNVSNSRISQITKAIKKAELHRQDKCEFVSLLHSLNPSVRIYVSKMLGGKYGVS